MVSRKYKLTTRLIGVVDVIRKSALFLALIFVMVCPLVVFSADVTIAIMPFEGGEIGEWYIDRYQMLNGITQTVTDKLSDRAWLRVVERDRIEHILQEQDLVLSGTVDPYNAAQLGRLLGADVLLMGTLTTLQQTGSGGIRVGIVRLGGSVAKAELSARLVDVTTGVVLGSVQGSGSQTGVSVAVDNLRGISFSSETFRNSILGKALFQAVDDLIANFEESFRDIELGRGAPSEKITGQILAVIGDKYVINLGEGDKIKPGDRFKVSESVQVPGLSKPVEVPVGTLRVISVDEEASVGESLEGKFKEGYVIEKE
ncbi:MAG: CsgG/HfaB family protein [Limnochordia bacterium]|jgi:hypothetical protein